MSRDLTGVEGGDEVLAALKDLGGEASTEEIAERAEVNSTAALVSLGKLGGKRLVHPVESDRPVRGNPSWRVPEVGEQGFVG